jgi:hypothetical protein
MSYADKERAQGRPSDRRGIGPQGPRRAAANSEPDRPGRKIELPAYCKKQLIFKIAATQDFLQTTQYIT